MAVTGVWYGNALAGQYSATAARRVDWVTDTVKVSLHTASYTPNQDTHDFYDDVTNEVTGTGYTAGGSTLASKSVSYDATTNELRLIAADVVWTTVTFTGARYAVVYKSTGTSSTSPLMGYIDFGGNQDISAGNFTIDFDATGILVITAA